MAIDLENVLAEHKKWIDSKGEEGRLANLQETYLRLADLRLANLEGANLRWVVLRRANLEGANLRYANLRYADLRDAEVRGADLRGADLRDAFLKRVKLRDAYLDEMYLDIPVTLSEVREVILSHRDRLNMRNWHVDEDWHNGKAKPVDECGTAHCIAGWAHHLAALRRPELLDEKVNVYLVGQLALGDEAAEHFFDSNDEALEWLESLDV